MEDTGNAAIQADIWMTQGFHGTAMGDRFLEGPVFSLSLKSFIMFSLDMSTDCAWLLHFPNWLQFELHSRAPE